MTLHRALLSMKFLIGMAPLPSAGKWFPKFAVFRKLVLPSHTLFSAIEVAGHIEAILDDLLKSLFTHRHLLNFMCRVFIYRPGHADTNSYSVHSFLFVFLLLCLFGGRASSWLGRRFVCKEILGITLGQSSVKYPMSTAQLLSCSRSL